MVQRTGSLELKRLSENEVEATEQRWMRGVVSDFLNFFKKDVWKKEKGKTKHMRRRIE